MAAIRRSNSSRIGRLLLNGRYSDLLLRCNGVELRVHRAIVCTQCPWFERACSGGGFLDEYERTIDFPDERPQILYKLLEFLYTGDVYDFEFSDIGEAVWREPFSSSSASAASSSTRSTAGRLGFQLAIAGLPPDEGDHACYSNATAQPLRRHHSVTTRPSTWTPSPLTPSPPPYTPTSTVTATGAQLTSPWSDRTPPRDDYEGFDEVASLYTYQRLYLAAEHKYAVPPLAAMALDRFTRVVRSHWVSVTHWACDRRVAVLIAELFAAAPPESDRLAICVCGLVASCYRECRPNLRRVMMQYPRFAVGVLDSLAEVGPAAGEGNSSESSSSWPP